MPDGATTDSRQRVLRSLPNEIIQLILGYLSSSQLKEVACVSKTLNGHATDVLWRTVCLQDKWTLHLNEHTQQIWSDRGRGESDEHDDTPIVQKLYLLATQKHLARKVQILTHRCHLPTPNIFEELPRMHFDGPLSRDARLLALLRLAIRNMTNVHTLQIIYGHMSLTGTLVRGFLDQERSCEVPLRKLWLESCCLDITTTHFLSPTRMTGLESVRLRRMQLARWQCFPRREMKYFEFSLSRGGNYYQLHNGAGNWSGSSVHLSSEGLPAHWPRYTLSDLKSKGAAFDAVMWQRLPHIREFVDANQNHYLDRDTLAPMFPVGSMRWLMELSTSTLTTLNLDWILLRESEHDPRDESSEMMKQLAAMRYPHLRAFQIRNAVLPLTKLPGDVYLMENDWLAFMEEHAKLQCLGWPIDRFYSHTRPSVETQHRARKLVGLLASKLVDLRIDALYTGHGEPPTDTCHTAEGSRERIRRRRFISDFAPHMRSIEQIKLEGGLPRDEKREIIRALHWCPLKKIVMIGVSFPGGNTWGPHGEWLKALDVGHSAELIFNFDEEDLPQPTSYWTRDLPVLTDFNFEPQYGWSYNLSTQGPLLQIVALHHAHTVEELKLCGYSGCPILTASTQTMTPTTGSILTSLCHFHNLKQLVISLWLLTWFEDSYRDTEIIQSWLDRRDPSSTALAVVTPPPQSPSQELLVDPGQFPNFPIRLPPRQDFNRWAVELKTRFSPSALAYRVAQDIGPYLSPHAKERPGGVRVRGSFCLGSREEHRAANDIFDLDIRVGGENQVLEFVGPREEGEPGRWWQKMDNRRWF